MKALNSESQFMKFIPLISALIYDQFKVSADRKYICNIEISRMYTPFYSFPYARYTNDVTVQQSYHSSGQILEGKAYFFC